MESRVIELIKELRGVVCRCGRSKPPKPKCESYNHRELIGLRARCGHTDILEAEAAVREIQAALPKCKVIIQ